MAAGREATRAKRWDDADAAFGAAMALARDPSDADALGERGYARLLAGRLDDARSDLDKALAHDSADARDRRFEPGLMSHLWFNMGLVREQTGDARGALHAFAIANALVPSKAAKAKLATRNVCPIDVRRQSPDAPKWKPLATWDDVAAWIEPREPAPTAKERVCRTNGCSGAPPWHLEHHEQGSAGGRVIESDLYVLVPVKSGFLGYDAGRSMRVEECSVLPSVRASLVAARIQVTTQTADPCRSETGAKAYVDDAFYERETGKHLVTLTRVVGLAANVSAAANAVHVDCSPYDDEDVPVPAAP